MTATISHPGARDWFEKRTFASSSLDVDALKRAKSALGITIGVCLPALNEEGTIGSICELIRSELMEDYAIVDELIVMDSGSEDSTLELARASGAATYSVDDIIPELPTSRRGGKGAALWKSVAVLESDIVVWLDSDTRNFGTHFVSRLVRPLLSHPDLVFVKAFYDRPLVGTGGLRTGGARVTELLVRPVLNLFYPLLAGVIQPLSGECAARKQTLMEIPMFTDYAVEIGLLFDIVARHGLDSIAQVDLGSRIHRNQDIPALGRMSFQVLQALLIRLDDAGHLKLEEELNHRFTQFASGAEGPIPLETDVAIEELPPMAAVLAAGT